MYRYPREDEKTFTFELIGSKIDIFWDGDNIFYPAVVTQYNETTGEHVVLYDNDDTNEEYRENLIASTWRIYDESMTVAEAEEQIKRDELRRECKVETEGLYGPAPVIRTNESKLSYSAMAVEAVYRLAEKNGSSLQSIRKFVLHNFPLKAQQTASFNALTLKAVNKAVAQNELERLKNTFKLSMAEKEKRRLKERRLDPRASSSSRRSDDDDKMSKFTSLYGSILENNKSLRRTWELAVTKRDKFLELQMPYLAPFLPPKNYFSKRAAHSHDDGISLQSSALPSNGILTLSNHHILPINGVDTSSSSHDHHGSLSHDPIENSMTLISHPSSSDTANSIHAATIAFDDGTDDMHDKASESIDTDIALQPDVDISFSSLHINRALKGVDILAKPPTLFADLHDYQLQGISWMVHMFKNGMPMILGDQMGLGKTLQSIGFLASLQYYLNLSGPHLIVVPLSVLSNWISEIERFCPSIRAVRFHGPKDERARIKMEELADISEFDVVVTTFEMLVAESNFFRRKYMWTSVIVDEGHRLKNEKSQLSEKLRMIPTICKVILTGTPLQNNLRELWALLHFLAPEVFNLSSADLFDEGFDLLRRKVDTTVLRNARKLLNVFMLRRLKDQVNIRLPSKKEITLVVPLTEQQTEWYKQLLCGLDQSLIDIVMKESSSDVEPNSTSSTSSNPDVNDSVASSTAVVRKKGRVRNEIDRLNQKDDDESSDTPNAGSDWRKLMNLLLQLRKICNHIYLMPEAAPDPYIVSEDIVSGSGKLLLLDRMLSRLRTDNHRVLIFSQFTSMLDILEDYCDMRQWPFARLDGNTNRVQRRLDVRRFNAANSPLFIFLISTRAGGLGLNLASADTVILYDSDWNPQVDIQAMERAHRIGQTKPVRIYRLVCRGSVEERMVSRADKKLFLNAMVAEADPDTEIIEDECDGDTTTQQADSEVSHALGVQGPAISKRELSSLIRFGANAIIDGGKDASSKQISDEDLDLLLERNGRDNSVSSSASISTTEHTISIDSSTSTVDKADIQTLDISMSMNPELSRKIEEVDLRQLGNFVYQKKKITSSNKINEQALNFDFLDSKRKRVERIKMVDGRGTGYGGAVPVLASNLDEPVIATPSASSFQKRGREWTHQAFCCLCGKSKDGSGKMRCAHCPRVFHTSCLDQYDPVWKGSGMFICPHHKCAGCGRSTASSGGLLFRCTSCLTSYCEDCLPQDEIESIGRSKELEKIGYVSRQSYFIKCPSCVVHDSIAIVSSTKTDPAAPLQKLTVCTHDRTTDEDAEDNDNINEIGEQVDGEADAQPDDSPQNEVLLYPTQYMRIHIEEVPETPKRKSSSISKKRSRSSSNRRSSRSSRKSRKRSTAKDNDQHPDDVDVEDDNELESVEDAPVSRNRRSSRSSKKSSMLDDDHISSSDVETACGLEEGLAMLLSKGEEMKTKFLFGNSHMIENATFIKKLNSRSMQWESIISKVFSGRYRSSAAFINDVKSYFGSLEDDMHALLNKSDCSDLYDEIEAELDIIESLQEYFESFASNIALA